MSCERIVRQVSSPSSPRVFIIHTTGLVFIGYYGNWTLLQMVRINTCVFRVKGVKHKTKSLVRCSLQLVYSCFISSTIVSPSVLVMDKLRGVVSVSFIATSIMVLGALAVLQQIRRLCSSRSGLSTSSSAQIFKWCGSGEMCG